MCLRILSDPLDPRVNPEMVKANVHTNAKGMEAVKLISVQISVILVESRDPVSLLILVAHVPELLDTAKNVSQNAREKLENNFLKMLITKPTKALINFNLFSNLICVFILFCATFSI